MSAPRAAEFRDHTLPHTRRLALASDRRWSAPILHDFGPLRRTVEAEWLRRWRKDRGAGNAYLREAAEFWRQAHPLVHNLRDLDDIHTRSHELARACKQGGTAAICQAWELEIPPGSPEASQRRGEDPLYWRRVMRRLVSRWWDQFMRLAGFVHKHRQLYCSDQCHRWVTQRQAANMRTLADLLAVSDQGDEIPLDELAESSMANPAHRFTEAMVRVRGMDEWAKAHGWEAFMATVTCPSRMHARHVKGGRANKRYDGTDPKGANDYLGRVFARVRAKLDREGIEWMGFRSAEPHHDGCPHWHALVFAPRRTVRYRLLRLVTEKGRKVRRRVEYTEAAYKAVERIIRHHAMADSPGEPGARKHRVKIERIDRAKGDAASYVAKYISKNLNGAGMEADLFGTPADHAAERIVAWARTWGIRQFAFYGQPSVTLYREYRRLREAPMPPHADLWAACDRYRWREVMEHQRGPRPAALVRSQKPKADRYGDPVPASLLPIIGVEIGVIPLATRLKTWSVQKSRKPLPNCSESSGSYARNLASLGCGPKQDLPSRPSGLGTCTASGRSGARRGTSAGGGGSGSSSGGGSEATRSKPFICPDLECPACRASRAPAGGALPDAAGGGPWTRVTNCTEAPEGAPERGPP